MNLKKHGVFVSETELYEDIIKNFNKECLPLECNSIFMNEEELKLLIYNLKNKISKESKQIVKKAIGTIEGHLSSPMYSNLNDKEWKDSAIICELFRNYFVSKNSSTLNTIELQIKIFNAIRNKNLKFYIAWGHAKRSCGGLKTDSYYSDFSEIYSISMLSTLMNAVGCILNKKVELTVYSGSDRFYPALFTNKKYSDEYDSQRNLISAILEPEYAVINFKKYPQSEYKSSHFEQNKVGVEDVERHYNTILLNIDWKNILENNISPHKIKIPKSFSTIKLNTEEIIILAITSILNEKNQSLWIKKLGNITVFNEIIDFFHNVCLISTKKYLSIHLQKNKKDIIPSDSIRLTVHKKYNMDTIPAIYLLGYKERNKLSQHTSCIIENKTLGFNSRFSILKNKKVHCVYVASKHLSWLQFPIQPIFYTDCDIKESIDTILKHKFFE